jgi:hypothetical protein
MTNSKPYYLNFLKEKKNYEYFDNLKFELDKRVYHYGEQFKTNNENRDTVINFLKKEFRILKAILDCRKNATNFKNVAINNAYFGLIDELKAQNFTPLKVPWISSYNKIGLYFDLLRYEKFLSKTTFDDLIEEDSFNFYSEIKNKLLYYYSNKNIKILSIYNDTCTYERMSIDIFKELNKPSFIFLHGLPGRYNIIDENRSDYLIVWGKKIKENYIKNGFDENKIIISGHPNYKFYNLSKINIKMSFDNILILSKGANSFPQGNSVQLADRGNLILYLLEIEEVLKKKNIKHVTFRPHPSENINWYYKFISKDFFRPDATKDINKSINKSSLVIGPRSTSFINSLMNNINYIVYDPLDYENLDFINSQQVPPFDKTDERLVVCNSKDELLENLSKFSIVNKEILHDYIEPNFNLNFLNKYI